MGEPLNLDPEALQRLQRLGGDVFVCKMIDLFLDYAGKRIAEARAAQVAGNFAAVEMAVHPLKSSAGNVGADRVQALAARSEALAETGPSEALTAALGELEQAFADIKPELEEKRRGFVPPAK